MAEAEGLNRPDALVRLAEIGLAALADGATPRSLRVDEQAAVVVHVDGTRVRAPEAGAVTSPCSAEPGGDPDAPAGEDSRGGGARVRPRSRERASKPDIPFGRVTGGPGLPAAVIERLACIGRVRLARRDGQGPHSDVLDLGRSRRLVTARQGQAIKLRDGDTCAHPGCTRRDRLEAHHVRHWLYGGRTDMDNLLMLCRAHHVSHHAGEFTIVPQGRGRFRFFRASGELPRRVDPSTLIADPTPIEDEHTHAANDAATPKWDGSKMDHDWAIATAAQHLNLPAGA